MVPTKVRYINTDWKHKNVAQKLVQRNLERAYSLSGRVNRGCMTPFGKWKIGLEQTGFTLTNNRTQCGNFRDENLSTVYICLNARLNMSTYR